MLARIQRLNRGQRFIVFILIFGGILFAMLAVTVAVILLTFNFSPRDQGTAVLEGVTVTTFIELPASNAYPAAVAVAPDGSVYTASYVSGTVWRVLPGGDLDEINNTGDQFGAITGLAAAPDGTLYVLDRVEWDFRAQGGMLWRVNADGAISAMGQLDTEGGFVAPDDVTVDADGHVYVSDRGLRQVWRFTPDGQNTLWWVVPADFPGAENVIPTGLAYDASQPSIIITDPETDTVFRVSLEGDITETLYVSDRETPLYRFDGVTVAPDGTIYLAGLGNNTVSRLREGVLTVIAEGFRGSSDVALLGSQLYVSNWDQRPLAPPPGLQPKLPFTLDVIDLAEAAQ